MAKALQHWRVLTHGKLAEIEPNILTVTGLIRMPLVMLPRRMTVVRLNDARLVVFSAIALDEPSMRRLDDFGRPAFLVVPNDEHRHDAKIWKDRYPAMQVVTPDGSRAGVEEVVPVGTTAPRFDDPAVQFVTVPGTREKEAALVVATPNGTTLVLNDLVGNIRDSHGFGGWMLRLMAMAGDQPQIPRRVRLVMVADKTALRMQLLRWADLPGLRRILVSHGAPLDVQPAEDLRRLALTLG